MYFKNPKHINGVQYCACIKQKKDNAAKHFGQGKRSAFLCVDRNGLPMNMFAGAKKKIQFCANIYLQIYFSSYLLIN